MVETFDCNNIKLKQGDKGAKVKLLQTHLKTLGYYTTYNGRNLLVDGDFGTYTTIALKNFQKATGHSADGVFGPKTCPDLNKKILEKNGTTTNSTNTATNFNSNVSTTKTTTVEAKINPYAVDMNKNIWRIEESNVYLGGLNLIASKITPNNAFRNGDWKTLDLADGSTYTYLGRPQLLKYTIEVYLTTDQYVQLKSELFKICAVPINVTSSLIETGMYTVHIDESNEGVYEKKLTFTLTEFKN